MKEELTILATGVVVTLIVYVIPAYFYAHWLALTLSIISAGISTAVLLRSKAGDLSRTYKFASGSILLLFFIATAFSVHNYIGAKKQKNVLVDIRQTIDTGIVSLQMRTDMLESLKIYKSREASRITIEDAFRSQMGDQLNEDGTVKPRQEGEEKSVSYHYEIISPDKIRLISVTRVSEGTDPEFENYEGQTGMGQYEVILTTDGVEYEKVN